MGNTKSVDLNNPNRARSLPLAPSYPTDKVLNESEIVDLALAVLGYSVLGIFFEGIMSNLSILAGVNMPDSVIVGDAGTIRKVDVEYYSTDSFFEIFSSILKIVWAIAGI